MAGKYDPLTRHLSSAALQDRRTVEMDFDEIADLVGGLPQSVSQRQWWANMDHPQAWAWRGAGFDVETVFLDRQRVRFTRRVAGVAVVARPAGPRDGPPVRGVGGGPGLVERVDVRVVLVWRPTGRVVLHTAGKLLFPRVDAVPGLYRLSLAGTGEVLGRVYVGETDNLRRRLAGNYRNPGPTQQTSLRVNAVLRDHLAAGGTVTAATEGSGQRIQRLAGAPTHAGDSFGALLRQCRLSARLSQEELAERSGLSVRTVRNVETGQVRSPRHHTARLLPTRCNWADRVEKRSLARRWSINGRSCGGWWKNTREILEARRREPTTQKVLGLEQKCPGSPSTALGRV
jgi:DNA-binding XRE family transcriptional regulator